MRERDLNRNFTDEHQLMRIRTILFPKKQTSSPPGTPYSPSIEHNVTVDNGQHVRSEIDRLRGQITNMLARGGGQAQSRCTERAYLDGIGKLAKELKSSAGQVREVFQEFVDHLPTRLASEPRSYSLHYHYSLLLQDVTWHNLARIIKRTLATGFSAIQEHSDSTKQIQERMAYVQQRREERNAKRRQIQLGRAFHMWKLNGKCLSVKQRSQEYLMECSLEGEQRLAQSLLDLPLLVLMLEELGRQAADISELLVLELDGERACKYMEEGLSAVSSSLETVTQRSLLQSGRSGLKFSRQEVTLGSSLTRQCVIKGEILFVSSLAKSLQYGQADNLCYWQSLNKSNPQSLRGGAIFYPIFDGQQRCIGVLRQYFYDGTLTALPTSKLEKICTFLQLGLNLEKQMRAIARQKSYHKEGYYMKMISMIKRLETIEGNEKDVMGLLYEELKNKLDISKLSIYKVESSSNETRDIMLKKLWGEGEDCSSVVSLAHQLLKQHSNYVYLQNRLVVYSNQMLFDLKLTEDKFSQSNVAPAQGKTFLPIQLIVSVMAKVQNIISGKEKESKLMMLKDQIAKENLLKQQYMRMKTNFEDISVNFICKINKQEHYTNQISNYITAIHSLINNLSYSQKTQACTPLYYLECQLGKSKKDRQFIKLEQNHSKIQKINELSTMMKVSIDQISTLYCDIRLQKQAKQFEASIVNTISIFMKAYLRQKDMIKVNSQSFKDILLQNQKNNALIPHFPTKQLKKKWEQSKIQCIYNCFKQIVQKFATIAFGCNGQAVWQKDKPTSTNMEDWKHSIYRLLQNPQGIIIEIINKNPIVPYNEFINLKKLTEYTFEAIQEESTLMITANKSIYRSKSTIYENSFMITLPIYFHLPNDGEIVISPNLNLVKQIFINLCQQFVDGVNIFNQRLKFTASKMKESDAKKNGFEKIKRKSIQSSNLMKNINFFMIKIIEFQNKLICQSFHQIQLTSHNKTYRKRCLMTQHAPIMKLCTTFGKILFDYPFGKLRKNIQFKKQKGKSIKIIHKFSNMYQRKLQDAAFAKIHKKSFKRSKIPIFMQFLQKIFTHCYFSAFHKIKKIQGEKQASSQVFNQFQQCQSLEDIRKKLSVIVPNYTLLLQIDTQQCITLYSPKQSHFCQSADASSLPLSSTYQAGPQGHFIWHYPIMDNQNSFQIKDRLNTLSKCLQIAIRNCKKTMSMGMIQCSMFHRTWIKSLKAKFFRMWMLQSNRLQMIERNRLNDSLYQMSIQSKTIKQKLKAQQKILRNNAIQNQELLRKQQEFKYSIAVNNQQVKVIEQNQIQLQNSRSLYQSLHRRSVVKGMFLLWRTNASHLTLSIAQKKLKNNIYFKKIAIKSIRSFFDARRKQYLFDFRYNLSQVKKKATFNSKELQKIEVMFEQRGARLITFQSELQEQQNSHRYSNRSGSDLSQSQFQHTKRQFDLNRSPLQKVELSADDYAKHANGAYKLNPKTLKFLKRMGKLQQ